MDFISLSLTTGKVSKETTGSRNVRTIRSFANEGGTKRQKFDRAPPRHYFCYKDQTASTTYHLLWFVQAKRQEEMLKEQIYPTV